jgi:O-antigen ligase
MIHKSIATALKCGVMVFLLFAPLFADGIWTTASGFIGSALREISAVCRDSSTQWMLIFCLTIYFVIFLISDSRARSDTPCLRPTNPNVWLASLVLLALLQYVLAYVTASHSIQILVLITGIVFGKAFAIWAGRRSNEIVHRVVFLIRSLVCLLVASAFWQPERAIVFKYHGISRWVSGWNNPNLYGLLMGTGLVLTAGMGVREWQSGNGARQKNLGQILCSITIILCGFGLFKSYSRGAWLAVFAGLIYLAAQTAKSSRFSVWFQRNWLPLTLLATSLSLLAFWQFRFSEQRPAQRIFSVANANDFSWRNRVTAWEGATRMMIDQPWAGFGWGQAETDYGKKYCPPRLNEGAAIEMNDYLMIGISAGVPALFCFAAYLVLSFRKKSALTLPIRHSTFSIFKTARAGSIVLLVGFWFDGGLFKLPAATVFWMLMELSRLESPVGDEVTSFISKSSIQSALPDVVTYSKNETCLRWLAGILAVLAAAQTTVYFGTPFLPVSDGTLAVARHCLIQRNEIKDFECLSTNAVWSGQKLKGLLEHVRLANYNRQLINWKLDDKIYQDFVLSPVITAELNEQLDWRRPLWEEFYLRIRHESSPEDTAKIVLKHLHERVTMTTLPNPPHDVPDIWLKKITDEAGFEIIYVAALRSVGVPARLNSNHNTEFWDGNNWQVDPPPSVINW